MARRSLQIGDSRKLPSRRHPAALEYRSSGTAHVFRRWRAKVLCSSWPPDLETPEVRRQIEREGYWGRTQVMAAEAARHRRIREYFGACCYRIESGSLSFILNYEYFARAGVASLQVTRLATQPIGIGMMQALEGHSTLSGGAYKMLCPYRSPPPIETRLDRAPNRSLQRMLARNGQPDIANARSTAGRASHRRYWRHQTFTLQGFSRRFVWQQDLSRKVE